ncbi:MAG: hypothetical protein LBC02_13185 [Planctomycetaceae bacterium]|jgi:hypothetical protein|nr:hypothetical protein [Planctomycetaceae bacterium]
MFRRNIASAIADLPLCSDENQNPKRTAALIADIKLVPATYLIYCSHFKIRFLQTALNLNFV